MNFFTQIHETRLTRGARRPAPAPRRRALPLHRRLFPIQPSERDIARAAVAEVLG